MDSSQDAILISSVRSVTYIRKRIPFPIKYITQKCWQYALKCHHPDHTNYELTKQPDPPDTLGRQQLWSTKTTFHLSLHKGAWAGEHKPRWKSPTQSNVIYLLAQCHILNTCKARVDKTLRLPRFGILTTWRQTYLQLPASTYDTSLASMKMLSRSSSIPRP